MKVWELREVLKQADDDDLVYVKTDTEDNPLPVLHVESKEEVIKRLGRSTDRGDAVVMSWYAGAKAASDWRNWPASQGGRRMAPKVNLGHSAARRKK